MEHLVIPSWNKVLRVNKEIWFLIPLNCRQMEVLNAQALWNSEVFHRQSAWNSFQFGSVKNQIRVSLSPEKEVCLRISCSMQVATEHKHKCVDILYSCRTNEKLVQQMCSESCQKFHMQIKCADAASQSSNLSGTRIIEMWKAGFRAVSILTNGPFHFATLWRQLEETSISRDECDPAMPGSTLGNIDKCLKMKNCQINLSCVTRTSKFVAELFTNFFAYSHLECHSEQKQKSAEEHSGSITF